MTQPQPQPQGRPNDVVAVRVVQSAAPPTGSDFSIGKQINDSREVNPPMGRVLRHGFAGSMSQVLLHVERALQRGADFEYLVSRGSKMVWTRLCDKFPTQYFTECCVLAFNGDVFVIGPKDEHELAMLRFKLWHPSTSKVPEKYSKEAEEFDGPMDDFKLQRVVPVPLSGPCPAAFT